MAICLYYITHIDNIPSILSNGILSHEQIESKHVKYTPIYDQHIVNNRREKIVSGSKNLWYFANLYFQPRNPMLFRVISEKSVDNIAILAIPASKIFELQGAYISKGNAASQITEIVPFDKELAIKINKYVGKLEWWTEEEGTKRRIMAECLIPEQIPGDYIDTIYVANHDIADKIKNQIANSNISVVPEPTMFFKPSREIGVTNYISLVQGDMFFSGLQTLTISVNCVGIMGKGLASRAKYQFPDVYVKYQDLCRRKSLSLGKPVLYKRESSFDYQLIDEPTKATITNGETWFLLFATKDHWKNDADNKGIEKGLIWLRDNYKKEGIKSLALPALGCGLGNLNWKDIGPMMCTILNPLDIKVWIYLPAEKNISEDMLKSDFLLSYKIG